MADQDVEGVFDEMGKSISSTDQPESSVEEPAIEIDGEKLTASQIREMKSGYLRQADYTRKTQELARMKKELEAKLNWADQWQRYLANNPSVVEYLKSLGARSSNPVSQSYENQTNPIEDKLADIDLKLEELELRKAHPDLTDEDMDAILETAYENDGISLASAYKLYMFDKKQSEAFSKGEKRALEQKQNVEKQKVVKPAAKVPSTPKSVSEMTEEEWRQSVLNEISKSMT